MEGMGWGTARGLEKEEKGREGEEEGGGGSRVSGTPNVLIYSK